jgi:mycofactocin radical SAM maturase
VTVALPLVEQFQYGLDAPICLTWELTYACNLSCVHCLSSSGRRDPAELSTAECKAVIDELERMQVFYVNIGGGEPTVRPDFWELVDYATAHRVGVKFSTNGVKITPDVARRLAGSDYVDVQISLDGATAEVNDAVRGVGSYDTAMRAMANLAQAGFVGFKISVVMTRHNVDQLDAFKAIADGFGAQLRITRLRPSGRGADVWDELHPTAAQQRQLYDWLVAHGEDVLTGDSFFHLAAFGDALPGLNLCGAGRVVCLIDILLVEAWQVHGERVQAEPEHFGATTLRLLQEGAEVPPERADAARVRRATLLPAATALLDGVDVLVGPAVAYPAPVENPPVDTPEGEIEGLFTGAYNVSGQPALVLPCGLTPDGLPVGLQLAAGVGDDAALLRAAAAIEAILSVS